MRHTCARVLAVVAFAGLLSSPATTAPMTVTSSTVVGASRAARRYGGPSRTPSTKD